jgi:primosomal protein N' (replication factor Y)
MSAPPSPVWTVALPVPLPRRFDYRPPDGAPADADAIGCRVRVPFGRRELVGIVVGTGTPELAPEAIKPVIARLDEAPLLHGELLDSLQWLARYLHAPLGEVLATALPTLLRHGEPLPDTRAWGWRLTVAGRAARWRPGRPQRLAERIGADTVAETDLDASIESWRDAARTLAARGLAERVEVDAVDVAPPAAAGPELHAEQRAAVDAVLEARDRFSTLLLDGVTGSGKTEVYLAAIADCLARGRQALVLVPEIGLTPQTLARFRARLGVPVHALHSGLSHGERARTWAACARGEARVIVGTRSAVFLPLPEAGLVVIDEEHDGSYKQLDGLRYHARDFALVRAKALGVPVVLGSATPSLESLHNAQLGRYTHLRLSHRAGVARAPRVRVLDIRKRALHAGLSNEMLDAIALTLRAEGQALVFKNRRGYAPVLLCHDCGWTADCARCSTPERASPMTVHAHGRRLQCHHCGTRRPAPPACPDCGGLALQPQGAGTERIEALLAERFPDVPVLRIDRGTTQRRDALEQHLATFGDRPGILVGTQMLAKGHDLPNLTLVAVVGIDEGLFSADFRAPEKLAQLLIQVSGRAGRARRAGEVVLQTHHPGHPLLHVLLEGGYPAFAQAELAQREAAGFPPFARLALLRAEAQRIEHADAFLRAASALLEGFDVQRFGPLPAPLPRRAGYQRLQLLVSAAERPALHAALASAVPALYDAPEARRVRWSLDVDPVDLY